MQQLVECVPNFSEGQDSSKIELIVSEIKGISGISLLDVSSGIDTNRSVVTFVGSISSVEEAAFHAIRVASEIIDMRKHKGTHARLGATDVFPFIPVSNVTMDDCISLSHRVAKRVGETLSIPIYLYEESAQIPERKNLANIRYGEYEGLSKKLSDKSWAPDYGPSELNKMSGATVMGAREFLIAYNINLNTLDKRMATDIAFEIREKGRAKRRDNPYSPNSLDGEIIRYKDKKYPCGICDFISNSYESIINHNNKHHDFDLRFLFKNKGYNKRNICGKPVIKPGIFNNIKAVGWVVDEYKRAQISINFTNFKKTPIHEVFDTVCKLSDIRGVRVTGSELVGLVPLSAMLMAGKYYLEKQYSTIGVPESRLVEVAVQTLGLSDVSAFNPKDKIIDYAVSNSNKKLIDMSLNEFGDELSKNSVAPGGGSVSALVGNLGSALISMVAALTFEKKGFEDSRKKMELSGAKAQLIKKKLASFIDDDTNAFNEVIEASRLPDSNNNEKKEKDLALLQANKKAINIPLEVSRLSFDVLELSCELINDINPNSISDLAVASEVSFAALRGAILNIYINMNEVKSDKQFADNILKEVDAMLNKAAELKDKIFKESLQIINS
jgi:glutamate formiminotransferase/formiminotetrahydrofolate cyclodeaminase